MTCKITVYIVSDRHALNRDRIFLLHVFIVAYFRCSKHQYSVSGCSRDTVTGCSYFDLGTSAYGDRFKGLAYAYAAIKRSSLTCCSGNGPQKPGKGGSLSW